MKKYLLVSIFLLSSLCSFGQVFVGEVNINSNDSIHVIEVFIDRRLSRKSVDVYVDFGQKDNSNALSIGRTEDLMITIPNSRKKMEFKSTSAVINFFESNNWEHYNSVALKEGNYPGFYYYFRKKR